MFFENPHGEVGLLHGPLLDIATDIVNGNIKNQQDLLARINRLKNSSQNLKRSEKAELLHKQGTTNGAGKRSYDFREELLAVNKGKEEAIEKLIAKVDNQAETQSFSAIDKVADKKGKVTFMPENDHLKEHQGHIEQLIDQIKNGEIGPNTVIALERKESGVNLGMNDIRKLAAILEYNGDNKNPDKIALPKDIENSPIYWDAMLYNAAKSRGIMVLGVEGKGLEHNQHSLEYNQDREDYMVKQINQLTEQGYDVIMPIGSAHVQSMEKQLGLREFSPVVCGMRLDMMINHLKDPIPLKLRSQVRRETMKQLMEIGKEKSLVTKDDMAKTLGEVRQRVISEKTSAAQPQLPKTEQEQQPIAEQQATEEEDHTSGLRM
jgi:hypothetical protein